MFGQGNEGTELTERAASSRAAVAPNWRMTLFVVLMLPLVLSLGGWQLQRAAYKQDLMDAYFDKLGGLPRALDADTATPAAFTRVRVEGDYEDVNLLLDNQISAGQPGYWVYSPFTAHGATWLVNRGWIAGSGNRTELPAVPPVPAGKVQLVALVWPDTGMLPLFGEQAHKQLATNVWRMQRIDFAAPPDGLAELVEGQLRDVELRLEDAQPGVLQAIPQTMGFGVERHKGYAIQWFGLAIALVAGYFFYRRSLSE